MLPWWIPWVGGGVAVVAVFWAGDNYGWNARQYAKCQALTEQRNADIAVVNRSEEAKHDDESRKAEEARIAFGKCPGVQSCVLTADTAACLNTLRAVP
jgi:hypothetical protein